MFVVSSLDWENLRLDIATRAPHVSATMNEVFKLISEGERLDQKEMAQILGMSEEAVEEQLEQLKKSGAFLGWIPVLNPEEGSENAVRGLIEVKLTPERAGDSIAWLSEFLDSKKWSPAI